MPQLTWMRQFKNRVGLKGSYRKFQKYMGDFDFVNLIEADQTIDWNNTNSISIDDIK